MDDVKEEGEHVAFNPKDEHAGKEKVSPTYMWGNHKCRVCVEPRFCMVFKTAATCVCLIFFVSAAFFVLFFSDGQKEPAAASETPPPQHPNWPQQHPNWQGQSTDNWRGFSSDDWKGVTILRGGKGYAQTPMGQVHYRDIGPQNYGYPIVLLHQSPMFMMQWGEVQNELSKMGIRSVIIDTPGYGMSDLPQEQPTIAEFADNLVPVLKHLRLDKVHLWLRDCHAVCSSDIVYGVKVVIAGQHTGAQRRQSDICGAWLTSIAPGAQIAASFAANHPERVSALVMHGAGCFTEEEVARYSSLHSGWDRTPLPDGSHLSHSFKNASQKMLDARTWLQIASFLQGPDIGHYAAFRYLMEPDLRAIRVPGLVLSDVTDSLHASDLHLVTALRPDFEYVEFSGADAEGGYFEQMMQPKRWAETVAAFLASLG